MIDRIEPQSFASLLKKVVDNRGKTCPVVEKGIPLIATNCISNNHLYPQFEKVRYVDVDVYENWFRGHPEPEDMIFVLKGTPGRVAWVPNPVGFCIAQDMVAIRPDEKKIYPKYLFAVLRSKTIQQEIEGLHVGTLIPHFKKGDFDDLQIPIVETDLQRYIGDQYFDLSSKIDLLHRQNNTLEAMAETLFRQWFVEEAHEDWEIGVINDLIGVFSGFPFKSTTFIVSGKYQLITIKAVQDGYLELSGADQISEIPSNMPDYCHLKIGDILLSLTGNVGRCCLVDHDDLLLNQRVAKLQPKQVRDWAFTYVLFRQSSMKRILEEFAKGTAQANLSPIETSTMEFVIPSEAMLEKYDECATPILKKVLHNKAQIKSLEKLRDTLLPKLMSGEVRVAC